MMKQGKKKKARRRDPLNVYAYVAVKKFYFLIETIPWLIIKISL